MITAVIPVYNNEDTIVQVLKALTGVSQINEIIVIDDASQDNSVAVIKRFIPQVKLLKNLQNLGKGGAVVRAVKIAKGDIILTCDADLSRLTCDHILKLINTFEQKKSDMVIGDERQPGLTGNLVNIFNLVSGERIFRKAVILPYLQLIARCGNGIEQIINFAHRGKQVDFVVLEDMGHILKYQRHRLPTMTYVYFKEAMDLVKTEYAISKIKVAYRFRYQIRPLSKYVYMIPYYKVPARKLFYLTKSVARRAGSIRHIYNRFYY